MTRNLRTVQLSLETRRRAAGGALARSAKTVRLSTAQRKAIVENGASAKQA